MPTHCYDLYRYQVYVLFHISKGCKLEAFVETLSKNCHECQDGPRGICYLNHFRGRVKVGPPSDQKKIDGLAFISQVVRVKGHSYF